jgi:hypothetical protein
MRSRHALPVLIAAVALIAPTGSAESVEACPEKAPASKAMQWPMAPERGEFDLVHFGEAHWNEGQGPITMPILVQDMVSADPEMVLFSSDIADIGTVDRLACFRSIMRPVDEAGIPWFASPGNHDRVAIAGPGGVANGAIDMWRSVFAGMPAPWGDKPAASRSFHVPEAEADDGEGAATHYYFDYGRNKKLSIRVIVLDNSQHSLTSSDVDQYPAVGPGEIDASQLAFLQRVAADAQEKGLESIVVMHQPTQDPRDLSNVHPVSLNHTMGKGASPDNAAFDAIAQVAGIDMVVLGHIQGNATYSVGDTDYYIDGGGGGSPYALREVGTDTGYFYGFRVLRMFQTADGLEHRTYLVPLIDELKIDGPRRASVGETIDLTGTAVQPFDPDLPPRLSAVPNEEIVLELRPPSDPKVPGPAYMWISSNPSILKPVNDEFPDDPSFDPKTMSVDGSFKAVGRGTATITLVSGTHRTTLRITVS